MLTNTNKQNPKCINFLILLKTILLRYLSVEVKDKFKHTLSVCCLNKRWIPRIANQIYRHKQIK